MSKRIPTSDLPAVVHDPLRLAALASYGILDTPPEQGFDDIVQLARQLCGAPVALVSLVAGDRQWFKAREGFPACETGLNASVCAHALTEADLLVIPNLATDPRTQNNPLVMGPPYIQFYAGAPLRTAEGHVLGSLCVIDHRPRPEGLAEARRDALRALARQVVTQLELRRVSDFQRKALDQRAILIRTQNAVTAAQGDLDTILAALVSGAMAAIPQAEGAVIQMREGETLVYRATHGTLADHTGLQVPLHGSLAGSCVLSGEGYRVGDVRADPRVKQELIETLQLRSCVIVPVRRGGETVGALKLQSNQPEAFTDADLAQAEVFAGSVTAGLAEAGEAAARRETSRLEQRRQAVFDSAHDYAMIVLDLGGRVTDWNSGATKILGWQPEEMRGSPADRFFTPEDRAAGIPAKEMQAALETGRGIDERWHLRRNGERFWALGEMMLLRDEDGTQTGFVKILRDRTEQRRSGEALAETAANLQRAQEAGGIGLFTVRLADNVLLPTPEFCRLYGLPERDSYPATAFEELVIPEDAHLVSTAATRELGAPPRDVEYRIRRADDGALRWIARKAEIVSDEQGRPARFTGVSRDITEQRAIRAALAASEQRYQTLFETIDEGFCVIRFLDGPHGPLSDYVHTEANPGYERNTGIVGIVGQTIRDLAPDEADGWVAIYRKVLDTGQAVRFEREFVAAGRHIEVAAHRVEPAGRREVALLFRDITARRKAEQALADSEQRLSLAFAASGTVGWYDWDIPADRLRGSPTLARLFNIAPEVAAAGMPIAKHFLAIHGDDRDRVAARINAAMTGDPSFEIDYRIVAADGTVSWVQSLGRINYDTAGKPVRFTGILTNITAARQTSARQAALLELSERLREDGDAKSIALIGAGVIGRVLQVRQVGYGNIDTDDLTLVVEQDWTAPRVPSLVGRYRMDEYVGYFPDLQQGRNVAISDVREDPRTIPTAAILESIGVRSLLNLPLVERGRLAAVLFINFDSPRPWLDPEIVFARQVAELVRQAVERRRAEEQQRLLNHELSHRLKNTLAMVQAIATQTLRNTADPATAREALAARLIALGKAHDILMSGTGESADLATVIQGALAIHDDGSRGRFRIAGATVICAAQPAMSVGLMMHELATNAAKYGALSVPAGHVEVSWTLHGPAARQELTLRWQEHGGPPVTPPQRQGFGSKLIQRGLAGAVGGVTKLDYSPEGVICTLTAPVAGFRGEA